MEWIDVAVLFVQYLFYLGLAAVGGWVIVNALKIWHKRREED